MTRFRYWLADLISGGELTRVCEAVVKRSTDQSHIVSRLSEVSNALDMALEMNARQKVSLSEMADRINLANYDAANGWANSERFARALRKIAAEVKPTSNATVRRMGRIAEEALK